MLPPDLLKPLTLESEVAITPIPSARHSVFWPIRLVSVSFSSALFGSCSCCSCSLSADALAALRMLCGCPAVCGFRAPFSIRVRPSVTHNSPFPILHAETVLAVVERDAERRRRGPDAWVRIAFAPASTKHKLRVQTAEQQCPHRKGASCARLVCWLSGERSLGTSLV